MYSRRRVASATSSLTCPSCSDSTGGVYMRVNRTFRARFRWARWHTYCIALYSIAWYLFALHLLSFVLHCTESSDGLNGMNRPSIYRQLGRRKYIRSLTHIDRTYAEHISNRSNEHLSNKYGLPPLPPTSSPHRSSLVARRSPLSLCSRLESRNPVMPTYSIFTLLS